MSQCYYVHCVSANVVVGLRPVGSCGMPSVGWLLASRWLGVNCSLGLGLYWFGFGFGPVISQVWWWLALRLHTIRDSQDRLDSMMGLFLRHTTGEKPTFVGRRERLL